MEHSKMEIIFFSAPSDKNIFTLFIEKPCNGTLGNLLRSVGSLNEDILKFITKKILRFISYYSYKIQIFTNNKNSNGIDDQIKQDYYILLDVDNICFDKNFNIKVYPNYLSKINKYPKEITNLFSIRNFSNLRVNLFSLGLLLIDCNIAMIGLNITKIFNSIENLKDINDDDECCLFHFLVKRYSLISTIINSQKFSGEYLNFLHYLTNFKENEKLFDIIIKEPWISQSNQITNSNNILELISISKNFNIKNEYYCSNNNLLDFFSIYEKIREQLLFCKDYFDYFLINEAKMIFSGNDVEIIELSKELKCDERNIRTDFYKLYQEYFSNRAIK